MMAVKQLQVESTHQITGKGLVWVIDLEKNEIPLTTEGVKSLMGMDVKWDKCEGIVTNVESSWKLTSPPVLDKIVALIIRIKQQLK